MPNSPSRKVSYQSLSPWKIRVTVEAEPEERTRTATRTMKVALKEDLPSPESVKDRGHTPLAASSVAKRRSAPVRGTRRSSSRARRQSVTDLNIIVLGDDDDLNEWSPQNSKKRGRPPSKKRKDERERQAGMDDEADSRPHYALGTEEEPNAAEDPGFQIRPDSDAEDHVPEAGSMEGESLELRKLDPNTVSVRSRSRPPKGRKSRHKKDESNASPQAIQKPALVLDMSTADSRTTEPAYPTPTSSVQDDLGCVRDLPADPTEHHGGFDTILESEGFTMIDLDSIPSACHLISPPTEQGREKKTGQVTTSAEKPDSGNSPSGPPSSASLPPVSSPGGQSQSKPRPTAIPSCLAISEGESELSSTIPSSPPGLAQAILVPPADSVIWRRDGRLCRILHHAYLRHHALPAAHLLHKLPNLKYPRPLSLDVL